MRANDLHETNFIGQRFTWSNNKTGNSKIWVRHDRILIDSRASNILPAAIVRHLPRIASDHCPLLFNTTSTPLQRNTRWIKFEDTWLSYPQTWKIVKEKWDKKDEGHCTDVLQRKCVRTLKAWSRNK